MRSSLLCTLSAALLSMLASHASASNVHVVDSTGFGDFLSIQPAIDAAADGDTILLRRPPDDDSRFGGFTVEGKGLSIVSLRRDAIETDFVFVRGLTADQTFSLNGLVIGERAILGPLQNQTRLRIENCAGAVRLRNCSVRGPVAGDPRDGRAACIVHNSADVVLRNCQMTGGAGNTAPAAGGAGLRVRGSSVVLYNCESTGGRGADDFIHFYYGPAIGGTGGPGAVVTNGSLYAVASTMTGGRGGGAYYGSSSLSGDGGAGLRVGLQSTAQFVDSSALGGPAGYSTDQFGVDGVDVQGQLSTIPSEGPRGFSVARRADEGSPFPVTFRGVPGDKVILLQSDSGTSRLLTPTAGLLHVGPPFDRLDIGVVPPSGELSFDYLVPEVEPANARRLVLQAGFLSQTGGLRLSAPAHVSALDELAPPICGQRIHVDRDAPVGGDGRSWATAFHRLQDALPFVTDCDARPTEIWIAEGTYKPAGINGDRQATFRLYSGARLYGGFSGNETEFDQRDTLAHPVILDGDLDGNDFTGPGLGPRSDNSRHVLQLGTRFLPDYAVILDGVTVSSGIGLGYDAEIKRGGGLLAFGSMTVKDCTFTENRAEWGAGVSAESATLTMLDCRIVGNRAYREGGGVYVRDHRPTDMGRTTIVNSIIAGNFIIGDGSGAGLAVSGDGSLDLISSLVYRNSIATAIGPVGVRASTDGEVNITNSILWGNATQGLTGQDQQVEATGVSIDYSCIEGLVTDLGGVGNIGADPAFVDTLGTDGVPGTLDDDLRLTAGSPCIDAGSNASVPADVLDQDGDGNLSEPLPFDLFGNPRFVDDPTVIDTGVGTPPLVDLGPHERQ